LNDFLKKYKTRRNFLAMSGTALLSSVLPFRTAYTAITRGADTSDVTALRNAAERLLGPLAKQIQLRCIPQISPEGFSISGAPGRILIQGSSLSALMMGMNWYLKYVAGVSIGWNGDCLDHLPAKLPAPASPIERQANVQHRFALNDTNDGYTGPYWSWEKWEHLIDVLALHGINEVLVYMGAEAVYQQAFRKFRFTDKELRRWFPTPSHQPWWLLENMSGWVGPSVSQQLIDSRVALAAKITRRLRELGMKPVLPGYYGMVPDGFSEKNPGAHVVPQGTWLGMKRPDWLDPACDLFPAVTQEFYRVQQRLLGPATMFKMDPLHEGGRAGDVNIEDAAASIDEQLQAAHPGAIWAVLGWQENPSRKLLAGIRDKSHVLILDGLSDRYEYKDREEQWDNTPYAFGTIWNFGGHTTIGANVGVWNERYFDQLTKPQSRMNGIAVMPEASCNNPAAFAFFTELPWRSERPDLTRWFAQWAAYRYGGNDRHAIDAWDVLRRTAYDEKSGKWSESHDNLFSAQPSLATRSACSWSPQEPRYDLAVFQGAVGYFLQVHPSLRTSTAYCYDLVDIARQTIANQSRDLLPLINAAYIAQDAQEFRHLTQQWLEHITLLNRAVGAEASFLLGPWLAAARSAGKSPAEQDQLEFDARSLLLEWGAESSRGSGVHDYANREWNGLLEFYRERWSLYFSALETALLTHEPVREIDWFAFDQNWAKQTNSYAVHPTDNAYETINEIKNLMHS
jgi:alpha-N-acetylglucosaminidase